MSGTFNTLYEILRRKTSRYVVRVYDLSILSMRFLLLLLAASTVLVFTFDSLYEILSVLWRQKKNLDSFDSLYEILERVFELLSRRFRNFRFSLWDSLAMKEKVGYRIRLQLSILSMRFWSCFRRFYYRGVHSLSILSMRFLQVVSATFSRVDGAFYSLYEIHPSDVIRFPVYPWALSILSMRFKYVVCISHTPKYKVLSILSMRFHGDPEIRGGLHGAHGELSILSMRFLPHAGHRGGRSVQNFQYSLWDSPKNAVWEKFPPLLELSILSMRFYLDVKPTVWDLWLSLLSILSMRFITHSPRYRLGDLIFQYSLWDSGITSATFSPAALRHFQSSLWDSYKERRLSISKTRWISFLFSLWDSYNGVPGRWRSVVSLSILSMRFKKTQEDPILVVPFLLSILSMRFMGEPGGCSSNPSLLAFYSLYEILPRRRGNVVGWGWSSFLFSLWDSYSSDTCSSWWR